MIFRLLDISLSKHEVGFSIGSFFWDGEESERTLIGAYHQREANLTIFYLAFMGMVIDWDGVLDDED